MATWFIIREPDGQFNVMFRDKRLYATAGRCSAATPIRMIMEWLVNEGSPGDVIVSEEGAFALPFRTPRRWEVRC